ncbi:MAG: IscS subfamily cysteine desulfurase [Alphaproteobacteria bacterium]
MSLSKRIYLDYQATTPMDPRALDRMLPYFLERFGNPHSVTHAHGWEAEEAVEIAREQIAHVIGADPKEIVFTSGATEANNLAIKGAARFYRRERPHIVTCVAEHKCVLESCRAMEAEGFELTCVPTLNNGIVDLAALRDAVSARTCLVSIMAVNNEIGVIQPLAEIGEICQSAGALFHTDAAQGFGKIPLDVRAMNIALMSISAHKAYGPKGVGALYVRRRPRVRLIPLMSGGGQERGLRSGTVPAPLCVGFGWAAEIAEKEMADEALRLTALRDRFLARLRARVPDMVLNGDRERRIPGNLSLGFPGVNGDRLIAGLKGISVSSGSACSSASIEPSYVLAALGVPADLAQSALRIGLGRFTTAEEVDRAADEIAAVVEELRADATPEAPAETGA